MALLTKLKTLPRSVALILLCGLTLRIVLISVHQRPLVSDEKDYHRLALTFAKTGSFSDQGVPTAYRPFAYPATIALVYVVAGNEPIAVKLIQAFLDTLTALLLYLILTRSKLRTGITALAVWCFYIPAILYTNLLFTETMFTFLLVLCCYLVIETKIRSAKSALLIGVVLGLLTLMKSIMLLFILFVAVFMFIAWIPLKQYKFVVVGAVLVLAPWITRNYISFGKFTLGTNGGINLLTGNNPNTTGGYSTDFPEGVFDTNMSEVQADEAAYRYATSYILKHPFQFFLNGAKKMAHLFSSEGGLLVLTFHPDPEDFSERYAKKYASIGLLYTLLVNASYMMLLLTGILGILSTPRDLLWWFTATLLICWVAIHFIFLGTSRYHFPLMAFFAIYSSFVVPNIIATLRKLTAIRKLAFTLIATGLISIWVAEFYILYHA